MKDKPEGVLSDYAKPFDVHATPPCEIYVEKPIDTNDIQSRDILLPISTGTFPDIMTRIFFGRSEQCGIGYEDFCLIVSGADEVETTFGKYRLKPYASGARRVARCQEYRDKVRPVETWTYELVGGGIFTF